MAFTKIVGAGIATDTDVQVDDILAGIVTATRFDGDGSQLSGLPGGLGTALSSDSTSVLSAIYTNDRILSIGATITVDVPDSSSGAYTQYTDIVVEADADLIIEDGDDFIPDILGLSVPGSAELLPGAGGRVRADQFTNKAGTGAPSFPNGLTAAAGIVTAQSFVGDGSGLTGVVGQGSGIAIRDGGSIVGTATTIDFGSNLSVSPIFTGIVTVTASGGSSYTNSDVDSHLNQSNPTDGYVLSWTSGDYAWVSQSGGGGGSSLQSRTSVTGTTASIGVGDTANITVSAAKSYMLHKVGVSTAAWVRVYTDATNRTADESRSITADPAPGSGVIAEAITTGLSTTVLMTPGVMGFNNDSSPSSNVYLSVTNRGDTTQTVNVTLHYLQLEA